MGVVEGRVIAQRYRLLSQLGHGGMGSVWRAQHIELGTLVAVKLVDESIAENPEALARFRREAQAAATLRSNHVVQILDYGIDEGTPYIAMELMLGESLATRLERVVRIEPAAVAGIVRQVAKAVGRAHDSGIIHRDLKPDNIFLAQDGDDETVKVLDFGIAKNTNPFQETSDVQTRTGSILGSPYYMSPEQASGRKAVDARADIWALAVIAFECLTGSRPFQDTSLGGLLLAICTEPPPVPSERGPVPAGFDAWFARAVNRDPEGRFRTFREAAAALEKVCAAGAALEGSEVPPTVSFVRSGAQASAISTQMAASSTNGPPRMLGRRRWATVGAIAAGILAVLGVGAAAAWRAATPETAAPATSSVAEAMVASQSPSSSQHGPVVVPAADAGPVAEPSAVPPAARTSTPAPPARPPRGPVPAAHPPAPASPAPPLAAPPAARPAAPPAVAPKPPRNPADELGI